MTSETLLELMHYNKPLSSVCTLGIGGAARYYLEVHSILEMQEALLYCKARKIQYLILGKGSNCLFDDSGYDGVVIGNKIDFFESPAPGVFHVGAGYSFSLLGVQTARKSWRGLEFASGIPASVGGAVFMNAGANGNETADCLSTIDYIDEEGCLHYLNKDDLHFSYRTSSFQKRGGAIVGATFVLQPDPNARSKQLEIIHYRKKTQPYGDKSAGCVFRNPDCRYAGALIESAGLKGVKIGGAQVSTLHANFLINAGGATYQDFLALISLVKNTVKEKHGIHLEQEVRVIYNDERGHHE